MDQKFFDDVHALLDELFEDVRTVLTALEIYAGDAVSARTAQAMERLNKTLGEYNKGIQHGR